MAPEKIKIKDVGQWELAIVSGMCRSYASSQVDNKDWKGRLTRSQAHALSDRLMKAARKRAKAIQLNLSECFVLMTVNEVAQGFGEADLALKDFVDQIHPKIC